MAAIAGMPDPLDPIKKPQQAPQPVGLDPYEGVKNMARDAASAVRGQFAPQPAPPVAPLMGPDTGSSVLPVLQKLDTHMRERTAAVPGLLKDAAGTVMDVGRGVVAAGQAENQRIQAIDNTPKERPGTVMGGVTNFFNGLVNKGLDAGVFDPDLKARQPILTPEQQHARPAAPAAPAAATPPTAATPASTVTPPAAVAPAPAALAKPSPEQSVQLQALISKQNSNRTPVSDPYAPVPGTQAAPTAGMPAPGGGGADLNGTPSQQTAYWAQQKAGLEERGRYADAQAAQQQAFNMMQADQDFKAKILEDIKANGEKYGPATMQALASLAGVNSGAQGPASAGTTGLASMANHMGMAAGDAEKNALTARGQDLTYAGHLLTGTNDMAKAKLNADVQREGHSTQKEIHAGNNTSAERRAKTAADAQRHHTDTSVQLAEAARGDWIINPMNPNQFVNKRAQTRMGMPLVPPK